MDHPITGREMRIDHTCPYESRRRRATATRIQFLIHIFKSFPKAQKFRKNPFPLFEALGELYDGQYAEGTWNFTSTQPPQYHVLTQVNEGDHLSSNGVEFPDLEESYAYQAQE